MRAVRRAAQYLRMSADQQRYSLENQAAAIALYAAAQGVEIIASHEDVGVSCLRANSRSGLQRLLADVVGGQADFDTVFVYDVSRWGRFQNPDESAHYEFICRAKAWSGERVRALLVNPKYAGVLVTGKRHTPLGGKRQASPAADWITAPALVSKQAFAATQRTLDRTAAAQTAELLDRLKTVAQVHGVVGEGRLKALGVRHHRAYRARFGSLRAAFAAIGYVPGRRGDAEGPRPAPPAKGKSNPGPHQRRSDIPCADRYRRRFKSLPAAYARIGFVRINAAQARSPLGQARLEARRLTIAPPAAAGLQAIWSTIRNTAPLAGSR